MILRTFLMAAMLALFPGVSQAASVAEVKQLLATLSLRKDSKSGIKERTIAAHPVTSKAGEVLLLFGPLVGKDNGEAMAEELKRAGLKPWPTKPALLVLIPGLMSVYYLIDEDSKGIVTHSGKIGGGWGGWIGQDTAPGNDLFDQHGGPQKLYDMVVTQALRKN